MLTILAVGATHPDEVDSLRFVESLESHRILGVEVLFANEKAMETGERCVCKNLALAFPGRLNSPCYEEHRAAEILEDVRKRNLDIVIDFHGMNGGGEKHAVMNLGMGVSPVVLGALKTLGVTKITTSGLNVYSHVPNAFALEIGSDEFTRRGHDFIRDWLKDLVNDPNPPRGSVKDFEWFEPFGDDLHIDTIHPNSFTKAEKEEFGSFKPLPPRIQELLGIAKEEVIYSRGNLQPPTAEGYFGETLRKIAPPSTNHWPR